MSSTLVRATNLRNITHRHQVASASQLWGGWPACFVAYKTQRRLCIGLLDLFYYTAGDSLSFPSTMSRLAREIFFTPDQDNPKWVSAANARAPEDTRYARHS